jgi:hypothetical protein
MGWVEGTFKPYLYMGLYLLRYLIAVLLPIITHHPFTGWGGTFAAWTVQLPFSLVLWPVLLWLDFGRNVFLSFDGIIIPPPPYFVKHFF